MVRPRSPFRGPRAGALRQRERRRATVQLKVKYQTCRQSRCRWHGRCGALCEEEVAQSPGDARSRTYVRHLPHMCMCMHMCMHMLTCTCFACPCPCHVFITDGPSGGEGRGEPPGTHGAWRWPGLSPGSGLTETATGPGVDTHCPAWGRLTRAPTISVLRRFKSFSF